MIRLLKALFRPEKCWHCEMPYGARPGAFCGGCGFLRLRRDPDHCDHIAVEPKAISEGSVVTERCRSCGYIRHRTKYYLGHWVEPSEASLERLDMSYIAIPSKPQVFYGKSLVEVRPSHYFPLPETPKTMLDPKMSGMDMEEKVEVERWMEELRASGTSPR